MNVFKILLYISSKLIKNYVLNINNMQYLLNILVTVFDFHLNYTYCK